MQELEAFAWGLQDLQGCAWGSCLGELHGGAAWGSCRDVQELQALQELQDLEVLQDLEELQGLQACLRSCIAEHL